MQEAIAPQSEGTKLTTAPVAYSNAFVTLYMTDSQTLPLLWYEIAGALSKFLKELSN